MDRARFLNKVGEGLVVGIMVALVITVTGVVWKGFSEATDRLRTATGDLRTAKDILDTQGSRNREQDAFNKKQLGTNQQMLAAIERLERTLENLARNATARKGSQAERDSLEARIGLVGADFDSIRKDLTDNQSEQERIQMQLIQRQEQQQMQQKKW